MELEHVIYEKSGHVATVMLNRPETGNALNARMYQELSDVWTDFKNDDEAWVAVLTGAGDKAFCVGRERGVWPDPPARPPLSERDEGFRVITAKHLTCWKPVVCAVNADCVGGALHFVADADIVICSETATFYDRHTEVGSTAVWEPLQLARKIPYEIAMRMMLLGDSERLDAKRAYEVGLVSQVVPQAQLVATAQDIAHKICQHDIYATIGTVEAVYKGQEMGMLQGVRHGLLIRQLQNYKRSLSQEA